MNTPSASPSPPPPSDQRKLVEGIWREILGLAEIDPDRTFVDLGGTSLGANQLVVKLARRLGIEVPVIRVFEYPTLRQFLRFLAHGPNSELVPDGIQSVRVSANNAAVLPSAATGAVSPLAGPAGNDVAIVGMACRFPGAGNVTQFWQNLVDGRDSIRALSDEEISPAVPEPIRADPRYVRAAGLIDQPFAMDAAFFDIKPMEARLVDPQHRVLLETSWEALENAGHGPGSFAGRAAVFAGTEDNSYYKTEIVPYPEAEARAGRLSVMTGNEKDFVAMRIAHKLDLRGPAVSVHTACSTSLVAVIMACKSLRNGECDLALAGGATVHFPTPEGYYFQEGGIFSSDGHCRPFDAAAEGTVFTDGVGVVVLKRLDEAVRDRNTIYAVIKGGAINNDGAAKISFSAPSVSGQASCIADALRDAGVEASSIGYVEAHGTATPVGDPIEVEGLRQAFALQSGPRQFCGLGSVKSNIGHTTAAAGVASLIKTALALQNGLIPASLYYRRPNPALDLENSPFYVVDQNRPWPRAAAPRRAGVSSFGIGGTNAHLILEEAPPPPPPTPSTRPFEILPVSARTASQRDRLLQTLDAEPHGLRDLAYTLQQGRTRFKHRGAAIRLARWPQANTLVQPAPVALEDPSTVFLFPGQGSQYIQMGRSLAAELPEFRDAFARCCRLISDELGFDFQEFIFDAANQQTLEETRYTQPALFAIEVSLGRMLLDWGVRPNFMVGHSVGEFAAAHLAGVFSLEDGVRMITARGRLMGDLPRGRMLSARADIAAVRAAAAEAVDVASINSPVHSVLAGPDECIARVQARLEAAGIPCRPLHTSHAFHSAMMDPVVAPFLELVRGVHLQAPRIPIISTVTGEPLRDADASDPAYWARHLRATVQFSPAVQRALQEGGNLFIEVGPRTTLSSLAIQHFPKGGAPAVAVSLLADTAEPETELAALAAGLARLWCSGLELAWQRIWPAAVLVPFAASYPFERKDYRFSEGRQPPLRERTAPPLAPPQQAPVAPLAPPFAAPVAADATPVLGRQLAELFAEFAGMAIEQPDTTFIEAGFDSLVLMQIGVELGKKYGVSVSLGDLMRRHNTLPRLTAHIAQSADPLRLPPTPTAPAAPAPAPASVPDPVAAAVTARALPDLPPDAGRQDAAQLIDAQMRQMKEIFELQLRYLAPAPAAQAVAVPAPSGAASPATPPVPPPLAHARAARPAPPVPAIRPRDDASVAPLTVMQERIRFIEEMQPGRAVYSIASGHRLGGPMNPALFAQALREVIRRQSALRTVIARAPDGRWVQRVQEQLDFRLPYEDLSGLPADLRDGELRQQMQSIADQPFDIRVAPLFRAALWKVDTEQHAFLFVPHHLIWDGWSFDLLFDELAASYGALLHGESTPLAPLPIHYGDFAVWHEQWRASPDFTAQRNYWKALFEHLPAPPPVLTDKPRAGGRSGRGGVEWIRIDQERADRLRAIARSAGTSLSMLMTAVYAALIQQRAGAEHVVIGVVVRGRRLPELEPIMGFFNNLLPLPLRVDRRQAFSQWAGAVGDLLAQAYERQDVPFEQLAVEPELAGWARQAGVPYHALISFQDARKRNRNWGELVHEAISFGQYTATEDFGLWVTELTDGIEARLVYDADVFHAQTAEQLRRRLETMIDRVIENPGQALGALTALTGAEEAALQAWSAAAAGARVLDTDGALVPIGAPGLLWRDGGNTGQRARWRSDGVLEMLDAVDVPPPAQVRGPAEPGAGSLSPTERVLAEVWAATLQVSGIGPADNFFELGGTSLQAMQAAVLLEGRLGQSINARKFVMESLRSLARSYDGAAPVDGAAAPALGSTSGDAIAAAAAIAVASGAARRQRNRQHKTGLLGRLAGTFGRAAPAAEPYGGGAAAAGSAPVATASVSTTAQVAVREAAGVASPPVASHGLEVLGPSGLRCVPRAQPPVSGAFRAPDGSGGQAWYRLDESTGRYEIV